VAGALGGQRQGSTVDVAPLCASLTGGHFASAVAGDGAAVEPTLPPLNEAVPQVAMAPALLQERLALVPVFTVTNAQNEFILVSGLPQGGGEGAGKQLGLFFFSEKDAGSLLEQIRKGNPVIGRNARVTAIGLDKVYSLMRAQESGVDQEGVSAAATEGIAFRFLPDAMQIKNALEILHADNRDTDHFKGVPVFQAEGLTIRTEKKRYLPLFFSREDLEKALTNAGKKQGDTNARMPRPSHIEVGSFENVLKQMEMSDAPEWSEVVFMASNTGMLNKIIMQKP